MNKITSIERKELNENYLNKIGVPYIEYLPAIEEGDETTIRGANEIAKRILILTYLSYAGEVEEDKCEVVDFLKKENLWNSVSPAEQLLLTQKKKFNDQEKIDISWKSECIYIMLWTLNKIEEIELPIDDIQIPEIIQFLPDFMSSTAEFISSAELRSKTEILNYADLIYRLHWAAKHKELESEIALNSSVAMERHYAINWIINYEELSWDEITTDT